MVVLLAAPALAKPNPFSPVLPVVQKEMARQHVSGAALVIYQRGQVQLIRGFNLGGLTPVPLGDASQAFTAYKLANDPQVDLDRPVFNYLSDFKLSQEITLRQLLSHTSGLADGPLTRDSVQSPPGLVFSYSRTGFDVANRALVQVTGGNVTPTWTTTPQGATAFLRMMLGETKLSVPVLGIPPFRKAFGLGLWTGQRRGLPTVYQQGPQCYLETIPSLGLGVAVLATQPIDPEPIMAATLNALKVPVPPASPVPTPDPGDYQGLYEWTNPQDGTVEIWRMQGLTLEPRGELTPVGPDAFTVAGQQVAFLRDVPGGPVTFLNVLQSAPKLPPLARDVNVQGELRALRGVLQSPSRSQNDVVAARAAAAPALLLAFGTADLLENGAHDELRRCLNSLGMVGLHLTLKGLDLRRDEHLKRVQTALEIAQEKGVPVYFELQDAQGRTLDASTLKLFVEQVAVPYPNVRLAFAHAGGSGLDPLADLTATRNLVEAYRDHPQAWQNAFLVLNETGLPELQEPLRLWGFPRVLLGGDGLTVLRTPMRRAERLGLATNDASAWLGR